MLKILRLRCDQAKGIAFTKPILYLNFSTRHRKLKERIPSSPFTTLHPRTRPPSGAPSTSTKHPNSTSLLTNFAHTTPDTFQTGRTASGSLYGRLSSWAVCSMASSGEGWICIRGARLGRADVTIHNRRGGYLRVQLDETSCARPTFIRVIPTGSQFTST